MDFQKLLFLYSAEPTSGKPYDFVPYKFGAFSFTSNADIRKLIERGLLVDDEQIWELTEDGRRIVGGTADFQMGAFARRYGKLRRNDLVAHTYRRFPYSAIGFSKTALARGCEGVGIRYEHLPELGIASNQRRGLDTQADYDALFAEYEQKWLPTQAPALEQVKTWSDEGERIALTCYERLPQQCHRHCVAKKLVERFGPEFNPAHL